MYRYKIKESQIQKNILLYLSMQERIGKLVAIRNNSFSGKLTRPNGTEGYIKNAKKGAADILIFIPGGVTLHIEVKTIEGEQSPSQEIHMNKLETLGHLYFVVTNLPDVIKLIEKYSR